MIADLKIKKQAIELFTIPVGSSANPQSTLQFMSSIDIKKHQDLMVNQFDCAIKTIENHVLIYDDFKAKKESIINIKKEDLDRSIKSLQDKGFHTMVPLLLFNERMKAKEKIGERKNLNNFIKSDLISNILTKVSFIKKYNKNDISRKIAEGYIEYIDSLTSNKSKEYINNIKKQDTLKNHIISNRHNIIDNKINVIESTKLLISHIADINAALPTNTQSPIDIPKKVNINNHIRQIKLVMTRILADTVTEEEFKIYLNLSNDTLTRLINLKETNYDIKTIEDLNRTIKNNNMQKILQEGYLDIRKHPLFLMKSQYGKQLVTSDINQINSNLLTKLDQIIIDNINDFSQINMNGRTFANSEFKDCDFSKLDVSLQKQIKDQGSNKFQNCKFSIPPSTPGRQIKSPTQNTPNINP